MTYIATLIAAIVAFIAIQQFLLARERFKLDLFEKRFAVFKATETFMNNTIQHHRIEDGALPQFDRDTQAASFLFDEDIVKFLIDIRTKANFVTACHALYKDQPVGPERTELVQKSSKTLEEFITTLGTLKDRFSPYLKFQNWKYGFILSISNVTK